MITYPTTLPGPDLKTAQFTPGDTFSRTEFEFGMRYRKTWESVYRVRYTFTLTDDQMKEFRHFYEQTLNGGMWKFKADWEIEGDRDTKVFHFLDRYTAKKTKSALYEVSATFHYVGVYKNNFS